MLGGVRRIMVLGKFCGWMGNGGAELTLCLVGNLWVTRDGAGKVSVFNS